MTHQQDGISPITRQFTDLMKLLGAIAGVLAVYTAMNWFVVHLYFNTLTTQISDLTNHVSSINEWRVQKSEDLAVQNERINSIEKRITSYDKLKSGSRSLEIQK